MSQPIQANSLNSDTLSELLELTRKQSVIEYDKLRAIEKQNLLLEEQTALEHERNLQLERLLTKLDLLLVIADNLQQHHHAPIIHILTLLHQKIDTVLEIQRMFVPKVADKQELERFTALLQNVMQKSVNIHTGASIGVGDVTGDFNQHGSIAGRNMQ